MMKKHSLLILFLIGFCFKCLSQVDHVSVLIGKTDTDVSNYLDSLNNTHPSSYYKIKRSTSSDGNLTFQVDSYLGDETYWHFYAIIIFFKRINGIEICTTQMIMGSLEFAQYNLSYVKDNFHFVSENVWEKPWVLLPQFKILAKFIRRDGAYPGFTISYELEDI